MLQDPSKTSSASLDSAVGLGSLEFPLLRMLVLPVVDLSDPFLVQLLHSCPLLQHLSVVHDPISTREQPISLPIANLVSLRFGSVPPLDGDDSDTPSFIKILENLRGNQSLRSLEMWGSGTINFLDSTRLAVVASFRLLTTLLLEAQDWRCELVRLYFPFQ